MTANLPINSLAFDDIKSALKAYLKGDTAYRDFNFDASGINTLLNVLAYQGHQLGYYVKMMSDESYVDSARTRSAMLALAKNTGYIPGSKTCATATVQLTIRTDTSSEPASRVILIPKGTSFQGQNITQDNRLYQVIDDVLVTNRTVVGSSVTYVSDPIVVYEGGYQSWQFAVDNSIFNQRFVIRDPDIDINTLRVNVLDHDSSTNSTPFVLAKDVFTLDGTTPAFFIATEENGYYQIFFGNGVYGKALQTGNIIQTNYVGTNGVSGNGANTFIYNAPPADPLQDTNVGNFSDFQVTVIDPAAGGLDQESVDEMRFSIPYHYRAQNRLITASDFQAKLLSEFRNIDSISVWGGESNITKEYGKVFLSIKPKFSDQLTGSARDYITSAIVQKYGAIGMDVVFVQPDYLEVSINIYAKIDLRQTNRSFGEIESLFLQRSNDYNNNFLNRFGAMLSDVMYMDALKDSEEEVVTMYTTKSVKKNMPIHYGTTAQLSSVFGNTLKHGISSSTFNYGNHVVYFQDELDGNIYIYDTATNARFIQTAQGYVDYTRGIIFFYFPTTATTTGFETDTDGFLTWTAQTSTPDVSTYLNNIVRIADTKVYLTS